MTACYILLTSIDTFLQAKFPNSDLLIYIIDDNTGKLIAASQANVAMKYKSDSYGSFTVETPTQVIGIHSNNLNVKQAEILLQNGTLSGARNKTVFVKEFSQMGLSWVQSGQLSHANGFDVKETRWNLDWRIVVIQAIKCPVGSRSDANSGARSHSSACKVRVFSPVVSQKRKIICSLILAVQPCKEDGPYFTSVGGGVESCECIPGYFMTNDRTCEVGVFHCFSMCILLL